MATLDQSYNLGVASANIEGPGSGKVEKIGQGVTVTQSGVLSQVKVKLKRSGTCTGNVEVEIYSDSGGLPSALISDTQTMAASAVAASETQYTFVFSTQPPITATNKYHISVGKSVDDGPGNTIDWSVDTSGSYGGGQVYRYINSAWGNGLATWDTKFEQYYDAAPVGATGNMFMLF